MEIVRSPCDVREESLRFLTEHLRSPYDSRTVLGVRPPSVYYQTCKNGSPERKRQAETSQNYTDDEDEPGEKQAALNDRIVQFY